MKLKDLLNMKDFKYRGVVTVGSNETISAAILKLVEHDRGALPVCNDQGELVGIITERDIVRKCLARSDALAKIKIQDVMSKQVVVGNPEDDLSYAINVMKEKRIRHIPIVDNQKMVTGMISMRDLLGVQLEECKTEVRYLGDYISGGYI
ncbi:cyclic nucleotide-binding/CBS domain-containing protein [Candidatus Omnitrophota bacterium]